MLRDAERRWLLVPRDVVRRGDRPGLGERFRLLDQLRRDPCPLLGGLPAALALGALALGGWRGPPGPMRPLPPPVPRDGNLRKPPNRGQIYTRAPGLQDGARLLPPAAPRLHH